MKTYKLWVNIEEYDEDKDEYKDLTSEHEVEACSIGLFDTVEEAIAHSNMLSDTMYERIGQWTFVKSAEL